MIFPPIAQVGCCSACVDADVARARRGCGRGTDRPTRSARGARPCPAARPSISCCSAECSESTGRSCAPVASASAITSSPPTTSDSLFASATSIALGRARRSSAPGRRSPRSRSARGPRPTRPRAARDPPGPASTSPPVQASPARAAASGSFSAIRPTPCSRACAIRASSERSAREPHELEGARGTRARHRAPGCRSSRSSRGSGAASYGDPVWQALPLDRLSAAPLDDSDTAPCGFDRFAPHRGGSNRCAFACVAPDDGPTGEGRIT